MGIQKTLRSRPPLFWIVNAIAVVIALLFITVLCVYFMSAEKEIVRAYKTGQRLRFELSTMRVEGEMRDLTKKPPSPPVSAPAAPAVKADVVPVPPANAPLLSETHSPALVRTSERSLSPAPREDLLTPSPVGLIPATNKDGITPSAYYAKPVSVPAKIPRIAIIVSGLGQKTELTEKALQLPENFSLAISPYAHNSIAWAQNARNLGFETYAELALETADYPSRDVGPLGLLGANSTDENAKRLYATLSQFPGFTGVLAPANETFSSYKTQLFPFIGEIHSHGLFLLCADSNSGFGQVIAARKMVRGVCADRILHQEFSETSLQEGLDALEQRAKNEGAAFGYVQASALSLPLLAEWGTALAAKGIMLVPASNLVPEQIIDIPLDAKAEKKDEKTKSENKEPAHE